MKRSRFEKLPEDDDGKEVKEYIPSASSRHLLLESSAQQGCPRRSSRRKRNADEREFTVSSQQTLKDLKVMVSVLCVCLNVKLSD